MNALDFFLLAFLAFGIFKGIMKGFIVQAASLLGVFLGVYIAKFYSQGFALSLFEWFDLSVKYIVPVAFFLIFVFVILVCHFLAKILDKSLRIGVLSQINQSLGAFFGFIKYAIILSILLNVFHAIDDRAHMIKQTKKDGSLLYNPIKKLVPAVFPYVEWEDFIKNDNN